MQSDRMKAMQQEAQQNLSELRKLQDSEADPVAKAIYRVGVVLAERLDFLRIDLVVNRPMPPPPSLGRR